MQRGKKPAVSFQYPQMDVVGFFYGGFLKGISDIHLEG